MAVMATAVNDGPRVVGFPVRFAASALAADLRRISLTIKLNASSSSNEANTQLKTSLFPNSSKATATTSESPAPRMVESTWRDQQWSFSCVNWSQDASLYQKSGRYLRHSLQCGHTDESRRATRPRSHPQGVFSECHVIERK